MGTTARSGATMSDTIKAEWEKVDKAMEEKVLKNNDTWKAFNEDRKTAFCKQLKEKEKTVRRLAKLLESNVPTFGDSIRQHLRNFCSDNAGQGKEKEKSEGKKEEDGPQWNAQE